MIQFGVFYVMKQIIIFIVIILSFSISLFSSVNDFNVVRIKYDGGGDWYGNKTIFLNIFSRLNKELGIKTGKKEVAIKITDESFFDYPVAYISGHGNIRFSENEVKRLRTYLISGGFLYADDDYGMDKSFRREMKKVFPELDFIELPFSHQIYHQYFNFPNGLPKIHEHDGGPPKGMGLFYKDRLVVFYSFNTDISDGCENVEIHNDPEEKREAALKMACNIIIFALKN